MPNVLSSFLPLVICFLVVTISSAPTQESRGPSTSVTPSQDEAEQIQKKFSDLVKEANEQPEIKKLQTQSIEAMKAYQVALDAAIAKEDPDILAKVKALQQSVLGSFQDAAMSFHSGFDQFSPENRQMLLDTRKQAMDTPTVKAAREKRNAAKTEDARRAADSEYKAALNKAMVEIDPKTAPLLDQLAVKPTPVPLITPAPAAPNSPAKTP